MALILLEKVHATSLDDDGMVVVEAGTQSLALGPCSYRCDFQPMGIGFF
jgi:hypothetical protein